MDMETFMKHNFLVSTNEENLHWDPDQMKSEAKGIHIWSFHGQPKILSLEVSFKDFDLFSRHNFLTLNILKVSWI